MPVIKPALFFIVQSPIIPVSLSWIRYFPIKDFGCFTVNKSAYYNACEGVRVAVLKKRRRINRNDN
jgi:hypothetical protein